MYLKYFIFLLSFVVLKTSLIAQNNQLRAYTIDDGLPQSQITDLTQDDLGYLWVATRGGGLCRFDGTEFQVWNHQQKLASNFVNALTYTRDSLFAGTRKGLSIKKGKEFMNIEGPEIDEIYEFDSALYFATAKGVFTYSNGKIKKYKIHPEIDQSNINDVIFDGKYYWIAADNGLWRLDNIIGDQKGAQKITTNNFVALAHANSYLYAATYDDGTLVFDPNGNHHDPILIREPLRITDIASVGDRELWIATDNDGITIVDTQTYNEKGRIAHRNGLEVANVNKIITDPNETIWITTLGGGFYKYFQNDFTHYDRNTGLQGNRIEAVHATKKEVWVATGGAKLSSIDQQGIHHIAVPPHFYETKIKTLVSDDQERIWVGTDSRGILLRASEKVYEFKSDSMYVDSISGYQIRLDTLVQNVIKNYRIDRSKGLLSDRIKVLETGTDHSIWAVTYSKGITNFRYDVAKDSVMTLQNFGLKEGLPSTKIRLIKKDLSGRLWYATQSGHLGYIHERRLTDLGVALPKAYGITTLCFDKKKIYLGTQTGGIWQASLENPSNVQLLKGEQQLASHIIHQLLLDDQGVLWAGMERGIAKITIDITDTIKEVVYFGKEDGFLGVETIPNAVAKDTNGALWFGANYGLTKYIPGVPIQKKRSGKLHFEDIQIGYESLDTLQLEQWTNSERVLPLASVQTQLSFVYKMVDIEHPKVVQYRFKLNEGAWSPWRIENRQNFSGLRYGKHQFQVQSRNFQRVESKPIRFQFVIATPWYKKAWFPWLIAGGVVVFLGFFGWGYIKRIKRRNREEQKQLQLQNEVLALEQKALQLQMNPHFIFNVLNGIKAMGLNNPQKMNRTINSFATLLRETLYNSRKEKITLDQELKTLRNYIEVEQLMTDKEFTYDISTNLEVDAEEILIPPMLVQPFVENAIRHGILKGQSAGVLKLNFYTKNQYLYGEITDNGMGVFASQEGKKKTDHQSVALKVTQERLEAISGKNALIIQELKNEDQTIIGTQVVFKIPLETEF